MRINWFSPLPPDRTDIANFSARVLPHIQSWADVIVWTNRKLQHGDTKPPWPVRVFDGTFTDWASINEADISIFNIGNNGQFHSWILDVALRVPGIVILHDLNLADLCLHYFREWSRTWKHPQAAPGCLPPELQRAFADGCSDSGEVFVASHGQALGLQLVTSAALGVLVHSAGADMLIRQTSDTPVASLPLPFHTASKPVRRPAPSGTRRLVVFGFLGTNRCLDEVVEAIGSHPQGSSFHLAVYGEILDPGRFRAAVKRYRIENQVTVHGFVSEAELDQAISSSHLAVNLRWPTMGEASGSLLRAWSLAVPSVVTRVGWYKDLPETTVAFVSPEDLIRDLQGQLSRLLEDPAAFERIGPQGYIQYLRFHTPEKYSEGIAGVLECTDRLRAQYAARLLCDQVGLRTQGWMSAGALGVCLDDFANQIACACLKGQEINRGGPAQSSHNLAQSRVGGSNVRRTDESPQEGAGLDRGRVFSHRQV